VEALDGETLQLHALPAWKLPVWLRAASPPGRGGLFGRSRGEYRSASTRLVDDDGPDRSRPGDSRTNDNRTSENRVKRDARDTPSVVANAGRRPRPPAAAGR
jgi:hypothetical protein